MFVLKSLSNDHASSTPEINRFIGERAEKLEVIERIYKVMKYGLRYVNSQVKEFTLEYLTNKSVL